MIRYQRRTDLTGMRALVTGGSSGIGAATARLLARRGVRVAIGGRNLEALAAVAADTGGICLPGDLRRPDLPRRTVETAVEALGGLDLVVINAGIGWAGQFAAMTDDDIDSLLDVNLRSAAHIARAAVTRLSAGGRLIFVGSIAGLVGAPHEAWYSATKAGLAALADGLRSELQPDGIGVSLITPGVVDTAYFARRDFPYERSHPQLMRPETVAEIIVGAAEHGRNDVIVPRWLSLPARVKVSFPNLYRILAARFA